MEHEDRIGQLIRAGRTVYYVILSNGYCKEFGRRDSAVHYLNLMGA